MDAVTPESARMPATTPARPSRHEAEEAVRTLIAWAGDDPAREGLLDTPKRVAKAWEEWFSGYGADPAVALGKTFEDVQGYDDMVMLTNIDVERVQDRRQSARPFHASRRKGLTNLSIEGGMIDALLENSAIMRQL